MKKKETLLLAALALVVVPATWNLLQKPEAEPVREPVILAPPTLPERPATPEAWFRAIRPRCTPADVRLATDLNPPPRGTAGLGYKAACLGLARQTSSARALLLSLPDEERTEGAARVYDVAQALVDQGRPDVGGPLMELVLEFWPNHPMALYEAGAARFARGDTQAAQGYLERFLEVAPGDDSLTAEARRMVGGLAER